MRLERIDGLVCDVLRSEFGGRCWMLRGRLRCARKEEKKKKRRFSI